MFKQSFIPGFPHGAQRIGEALSILSEGASVIYYVGGDNYFSHPRGDKAAERYAFACLMENGHVRAADLQKPPLSLPHRTLMNWCAQYRKEGSSSFFRGAPLRKPPVMTEAIRAQSASLLSAGNSPCEIARQLGIKDSTLRKAIARKAIPMVAPSTTGQTGTSASGEVDNQQEMLQRQGSNKSERSQADAQAASGIGTACTRADERVEAAFGLATSAVARYESVCDVPMGGLLAGLPARHPRALQQCAQYPGSISHRGQDE